MMRGRENLPWPTGVKDEDGKIIVIPTSAAKDYVNERFWQAYRVYLVTETLGCLPFGGGWAEQPEWIVTALTAFKSEMALWRQEQNIKEEKMRKWRRNGR